MFAKHCSSLAKVALSCSRAEWSSSSKAVDMSPCCTAKSTEINTNITTNEKFNSIEQ